MTSNAGEFHNMTRHALNVGVSIVAIMSGVGAALAQDATPIPPISVMDTAARPAEGGGAPGSAAPLEGSEAAGYKPTTFQDFGPFGKMPILDIPYSVNVMSSALLENTLASTPDDIYKINPLIQAYTPSGRAVGPANFIGRGFNQTNINGRAEDGMRVGSLWQEAIEDKERVEYISSLTSFLYGVGDVGGLLNYVYKRPTATPLANVTIGDYGNLAGFVHGDFGGPIDKEGQFGYRLNLVGQTGDLPVYFQQNQRSLVSGALDWHINNDTLLEALGSHQYVRFSGNAPAWIFPTNANGSSRALHPAAPDTSDDFAQSWTHTDTQTDRFAIDFSSKLNEIFTVRGAYEYRNDNIPYSTYSNNVVSSNSGLYSQSTLLNQREDNIVNSGYGFLDADFNTWSIHHKVTAGFYGNTFREDFAYGTTPTLSLSGLNFNSPTYVNQPASFFAITGPIYTLDYVAQTNFVLGDEIKFNEYVSALVGANYASVKEDAFGYGTGMLTTQYDKGQLSPTLSLIGKPAPWFSTYFTYSQSLEEGAIVPASGPIVYTNAGQAFAPTLGSQYEVGAKADVHGMLLTAALFRINKALQVTITNPNGTETLNQDGRQINSGLELTATGNVWEGFRIYGGMTLLDPRVSQYQANPLADGKLAQNVASILAKVTAEYDLPFAPGLTLTGGIYYTGAQAVDILNTNFLPSFTTEDLGLRYRGKLPTGQEAVYRLNVSNITNKHYWLDSLYTGAPRTIAMSAQVKF